MSPSRTKDNKRRNDDGATDQKHQKYKKKSNPDEPGVQKLKASLRQTRRLLAKDNLDPAVQIQTERRLKSLEADLAKAEIRRKERSMAVRYHKIKFFDKRKVIRKINQTKRALEASSLEKKERKKLQKELLKHRVDLNYIIHYPKLAKYISLYPSSTDNADTTDTDRLREERRAAVRGAMESGEMEAEPEMSKGLQGDTDEAEGEEDSVGEGESQNSNEELEEEPVFTKPTAKSHRSTKSKKSHPGPAEKKKPKAKTSSGSTQQLVDVREDDFFDT